MAPDSPATVQSRSSLIMSQAKNAAHSNDAPITTYVPLPSVRGKGIQARRSGMGSGPQGMTTCRTFPTPYTHAVGWSHPAPCSPQKPLHSHTSSSQDWRGGQDEGSEGPQAAAAMMMPPGTNDSVASGRPTPGASYHLRAFSSTLQYRPAFLPQCGEASGPLCQGKGVPKAW